MQTRLIDGDLTVHDGATYDSDLEVNGWVTVLSGALLVKGNLSCLGIEVESEASLICHELLANIVAVAGDPPGYEAGARVRAAKVRALVVHVVNTAMANIIAYRDVDAVYLQHDSTELLTSRDPTQADREYTIGELAVLRPEYYQLRKPDGPVQLDLAALRGALCAGANPFTRAPLVAWHTPTPAPAAQPPALGELTRWLAAHPGPQRALLDELPPWIDRLVALDQLTRIMARQRISRAIGSPKLAAQRDALLARLAP